MGVGGVDGGVGEHRDGGGVRMVFEAENPKRGLRFMEWGMELLWGQRGGASDSGISGRGVMAASANGVSGRRRTRRAIHPRGSPANGKTVLPELVAGRGGNDLGGAEWRRSVFLATLVLASVGGKSLAGVGRRICRLGVLASTKRIHTDTGVGMDGMGGDSLLFATV